MEPADPPSPPHQRQAPRDSRRTQAERSSTTIATVNEAVIRSLIEVGYARTTMSTVTEAAGVSRGAITHHYGTKRQMMIAAIGDLVIRHEAEILQASTDLPDSGDHPRVVLEMLWKVFKSDLFGAMLELWTAARTDDQLRSVLRQAEREQGARHRALFAELFGPAIAGHPNFGVALDLTFNLMRGMELTAILRENPAREQLLLDRLTELFTQLTAG